MRWINSQPSNGARLALGIIPFAAMLVAYAIGSAARLAENPTDKLLPGLVSFADAINRMAVIPDGRTGDIVLWTDTMASLVRLLSGLGIATALALTVGMLIGMLPYARSLLAPFVGAISMVPPLALLPILFIMLGLGEISKIALIVIGVMPVMIRDLALRAIELPREQIIKAETLGGNSLQIALRIVLPQILPRLITCLRLQIGPAWLFLIAAEAISSDSGLGYRIFLVRRYLAMDVIFPYVVWITLIAILMDFLLERVRLAVFPWSAPEIKP
ncbi:ABC transporter permease [Agrobacterium rosae]|uniref:ABC transporter permease subunit n=1 Tax=Agrobacterium rosae TaxID=1972867 RepID=A0AAE5RZ05_9HYPH|nr:ABC transporter permease subunit [Agrobacterium rosae]KAA3511427.1 ABC transporter permease subunit [Agrobacterium rosae]KAA3519149.1 ABC transporter permease subunit [Agrobacterium rosae]MBN7806970.1 ABC transporter permease subunit [Agrobacterium rosae]MCM2436209.1 ABC transporter permease subunit [Agrobacterium rosae]MDX8332258.1 ABC transporter permease subunit [Agrobacterium rosae]